MLKKGGVTTFKRGQLVQTYQNDLANTLSTARKIEPMWNGPYQVVEQMLNSYKLEDLNGNPLNSNFNARRLREFVPREGTELLAKQKEFEAELAKETEGPSPPTADVLPNEEQCKDVNNANVSMEEENERQNILSNHTEGDRGDRDEEEDEVKETKGGIGTRVAQRRRGRRLT